MFAKVGKKELTPFMYQTNHHLQKKCICKLQKYVTQGITFANDKCVMYLSDTFTKVVHEICNS